MGGRAGPGAGLYGSRGAASMSSQLAAQDPTPAASQTPPAAGLRSAILGGLRSPVVIFYLVFLFLSIPLLLPELYEINPWDEAGYLNSWRDLLAGDLPSVGRNPLIAAFYALTYLPFRASPFWMVYSASLSRLVLLTLMWFSAYRFALRLDRLAPPLLLLGMLFVTPLAYDLLRFPTDPLFASFSALSLSEMLSYRQAGGRRNLLWASLWMGLAALSRNDGLVLFPILLVLGAWIARRRGELGQGLLRLAVPFLAVIGSYVLAYGLTTGEFTLGTAERAYGNFLGGQIVVHRSSGSQNPLIEAQLEAREIFGTPEENDNNILRAILRNPPAYLERVVASLRGLPGVVLAAYGSRFVAPLFLLAAWGVVTLIQRREFELLSILLIWPAHLASGLAITLFRPGHLRLPYFVLFGLAAVGLWALIGSFERARQQAAWILILAGLTAYGYVDNKLAIAFGASLTLVAYAAGYLSWRWGWAGRGAPALTLAFLLAAGIIVRGGFQSPKLRALGDDAREQALLALVDHFPPNTTVAAGSPGLVLASGMRYAGLTSHDVPTGLSPEAFLEWLAANNVQAIYVDPTLYNDNPAIWEQIAPLIGVRYERLYVGDEGDIQVLLLPGP